VRRHILVQGDVNQETQAALTAIVRTEPPAFNITVNNRKDIKKFYNVAGSLVKEPETATI
jgi:hypothetical protein